MPSRRLDEAAREERRANREARRRLGEISQEEAERALYIDFEGNKDAEPTFLGYLADGKHTALLIEDTFHLLERPARGFEHSERLCVVSMDDALAHICERAAAEERLIISFSGHEQRMIEEYATDQELKQSFSERYRDSKVLLERNLREEGIRFDRGDRTLESYCKAFDFQSPIPPARGASRAIRDLRAPLHRVNRWRQLRESWKNLARELLSYNRMDCERLRDLTLKALNLP